MMSFMKPFFATLLRNRRGAACTLCVSLLLYMVGVVGTWSARCFLDRQMHELPGGMTPVLAVLLGAKGFKDHTDAKADTPAGDVPGER